MERYLLKEPKNGGYRKPMLRIRLNKGMFWVSGKRLVDQANIIRRNSWMTGLKIEERERNLVENDSCKEEDRSADDTGEEVRDIMTALEADGKIGNLEEEEIAIIEEIAESTSYQLLEMYQRRSYYRKLPRLMRFCVI